MNACKSKILDNFWFQTGTPTYLVNLLKESDYDLRLLIEGVEVTASAFFEYRAEVKNPLPMIYQSGYLTSRITIGMFYCTLWVFPMTKYAMVS